MSDLALPWPALLAMGLALASFVGVLAARWPAALADSPAPTATDLLARLCRPPSHCPHCHTRLRIYELIPVLSWLAQRGRCRHCQAPLGMGDTLLELTGAALALLLGWRHGADGLGLAAGLLFAFTLLALAWLDARSLWLPDALTLPLLWAGLLYTSLRAPAALPEHVWAAALGYGLLAGLNAIHLVLRRRHGLGGGDAKLLAALGAWLGLWALPQILTLAALAGLIWALFTRQRALAFGPWLAAAGLAGWLWPGFTLL